MTDNSPAASLPRNANPASGSLRNRCMSIIGIIVLLVVAGIAYLLLRDPVFAVRIGGERLERMQQSPQWQGGKFVNVEPQWINWTSAWKGLILGKANPHAVPGSALPLVTPDPALFDSPPQSGLRTTWLGHSTALIEIDGSRVLIDPVWGERSSPFGFVGPKRWYAPLISLKDLHNRVDVVVISHGHYDHLDYHTIKEMRDWNTRFVVPLGIGAYLEYWGIKPERITELDWWESVRVGELDVVVTPARHSSVRASLGAQALWSSFAFIGAEHRVWYSGDTGFHQTLDEIGERFGPFDLTLIDAGQYNADWPDDHLGPEFALEANHRVRGKVMMPVHWGLFKLANHTWTEPVERLLVKAWLF